MRIDDQITLADLDYEAFTNKFKPKKTTDDCYTPPTIYDTVLAWVIEEYGIDSADVVRPFWPGENYLTYDFPDGCVVVDNPPFSMITQICKDFLRAGIKFFLFAPYLTCLNICPQDVAHIITGSRITYENGAIVDTAFVTNLESCLARSVPDLGRRIREENERLQREKTKQLPKYKYPPEVVTAAMVGYMAIHGVPWKLEKGLFVRKLDNMAGKTIFGGGYLIAEKAAAEKAAAEKAAAEKAAAKEWELSDRERMMIKRLEVEES